MSNQPDQPQPYSRPTPGYASPEYSAVPGQPHYGQPQHPQQQYAQPQYGAPMNYQGGPGYVDSTSGPRGLSLSSMIIGLVALFTFLPGMLIVPQLVGIVLGHIGLSRESPQGRPFAITGLITNYLALMICIGIYVFLVVFAGSVSDYSTGPGDTWS